MNWMALLIGAVILWLLWVIRGAAELPVKKEVVATVNHRGPRPLRPRTPEDCPACCAQAGHGAAEAGVAVQPWSEVRSRRGRRKQIDTDGHACPNERCVYYGIRDAQVHALVGDGHHGRGERIQDYLCGACGTKVSERQGTALYRLKTPGVRVSEVLAAVAEGLDVAAAVRVFGHAEGTIETWLTRGGEQAEKLHGRLFRGLMLGHVQLDELRTTVREKVREAWVWVALDVETKVIATLAIGPRTQKMAHELVHRLREVMAVGCIPVFSSDGLDMYFYALTAHFGRWQEVVGRKKREWVVAVGLVYGQVKKHYRRRRVVRVEHRMRWGSKEELKRRLTGLGLSGRLNTAYVERVNLTLRQGVGLLERRTWGTAQTEEGLKVAVEWWRGYYHLVRPHQGLRVEVGQADEGITTGRQGQRRRYRQRTPAVAAGVTDHRWTVQEMLSYPIAMS